MLNIVNVGYDSTNYYVIETGRARLLVDAGFPGTLPKLRHTLKRTGLSLEAVSHLLVTHYHPDHAGIAQELKQLGIRLIVLENQLEAIPALKHILKRDGRYVEITRDGNIQIHIPQSRTFLAGLGLAGEIVATPGHSPDHITLILDSGAAFTGDLPPEHMAEGLPQAVAGSWQKIRSYPVQTIYPGHGPVRDLS